MRSKQAVSKDEGDAMFKLSSAWVYMLRCADGSYYVGSARGSLEKRIGQHETGEMTGYTHERRPVTLVWSQDFQFIRDAVAFERRLKGWSRAKKEALIRGDYDKLPGLSRRGFKPSVLCASSFETAASRPPQDEAQGHARHSGMTAPISLVLARAQNGVIGNKGAIPWRLPEDMRRFKSLTLGKPVIMGRKTWESLPKKPLPGRTNIVVTRDPAYAAESAILAHTLDEAIAAAQHEAPSEIAVIGGAEIYAAALPRAAIVHLTEVHADIAGDTVMPPFDPRDWAEAAREDHPPSEPGGVAFSFVTLKHR